MLSVVRKISETEVKNKTALWWFLGACAVLAVLLLMKTINIIIGTALFAVALAILGLVSRRDRRSQNGNSKP